jgi:hypothetical protein
MGFFIIFRKKDDPVAVFLVLAVLGLIVFVTGNLVSSIKEKIPAFIELLYRYLVWVGPGLILIASLITILSRETGADRRICGICALLSIGACVLLAVLLRIRLRMSGDGLEVVFLFFSYWLLHLIYSGIVKAVKNRMVSAGDSGLAGVKFLSVFVMFWFFLAVSTTSVASYFMMNVNHTSCFHGIEAMFISGVITVACTVFCFFSGWPLLKND